MSEIKENNKNLTGSIHTVEDRSGEHHHHHHHHHLSEGHHSSSEHHSSSNYHSSGGHHHSHSYSRHRSSGRHKFKLGKNNLALKERILKALPSSRSSSRSKLSKFANSQKNKKRSKYAVISSRVLFCAIVIIIFSVVIYNINKENEDPTLQRASYIPSETSQLKIQVVQLQEEVSKLTEELEKYKAKYGELEEDTENDNSGKQTSKK